MNRPWLEFCDDDVPRTLEYAPVPVPEFLHSWARRFPDHTTIVFLGHRSICGQPAILGNRLSSHRRTGRQVRR